MAGASKNGEIDYWPGYVDALTSMVKVLTFVMMLLAMCIAVISQQISHDVVERVAAAAGVEVPQPGKIDDRLATLVKELQTLREPTAQVPESSAKPDDVEKSVSVAAAEVIVNEPQPTPKPVADKDGLVINFPADRTEIDEPSTLDVKQFVAQKKTDGKTAFSIETTVDPTTASLSKARREAYYRVMLVREVLRQAGVAQENISVAVQTRQGVPANRVIVSAP